MINTLKIYNDLKQTMDPSAAEKIVEVIGSVYEELRNSVTKTEFNELKEAVRELAVNVSRLERKVEDLVGEMKRMKGSMQDMKQEIGGLYHTVGYRLEDEAMKSLPSLLKRDLSVDTQGPLIRDYIDIGPKKYMELNIWGHGVKDGKAVEIVGEAKSQLKKRDVDKFLEALEILEPIINKQIVPLLVTYQTSPDVRRYIQGKNIALYFSYQL
jgi:uncharacterized coiled-coil protein SlyX